MTQLLKEKAATSRELLDFVSLAIRIGPLILTKTMFKQKIQPRQASGMGNFFPASYLAKL